LRKLHPQNTSAKHTRDRPSSPALLSIANDLVLHRQREFDSFVPSHNFKNYRDTMPCRSAQSPFASFCQSDIPLVLSTSSILFEKRESP